MSIVIRFHKCALCVDAPDLDLKWIQCEFDPDSGPRVDTALVRKLLCRGVNQRIVIGTF